MKRLFKKVFGQIVHGLCWTMLLFLAFGVALFVWLSYGLPGAWMQSFFDTFVPREVGTISIDWVAYRPGQGLVVEGFHWQDATQARTLAQCKKAKIKFSLLNTKPFSKRLKSVVLEDLYVAPIDPSEALDDPRERYQPHLPAPDFSALSLDISPFKLLLERPSVLNIKAQRVTANCKAKGPCIYVSDIVTTIDSKATVKGTVTVDFSHRWIDLYLKGQAYHHQLNGIYLALSQPLIATYNNKFHLLAPAFGEAKIRVGLDKYEDIFDLALQITVPTEGDYNGVKFDEATGRIEVHGIWDTRTEISDIIARRRGHVVARGGLTFDCAADRFSFQAEAEGLQPEDYYRLIDLPFTKVLPPVICEGQATLSVVGALPLLSPQRVETVVLKDGHFRSHGPCTVYGDYQLADARMDFAMQEGVFEISSFEADVGPQREEHLQATLKVMPLDSGKAVDIHVKGATDGLSMKYISPRLVEKLGDDASCSGAGELYCRTDETLLSTLWANFDGKVTGTKLTRFNFFSVLTDFMANHIPGIASMTDVDELYAKGTIRNGVVDLHQLRLEGSLLSIEGLGRYNLVSEEIKASLIVGFINEDSYLGKATRVFLLPVARAMWQVHIGGTRKEPTWQLQTIVGTMKNLVTGEDSQLDLLRKEAEKVQDERSENESEQEDGAFTDLFFGAP
jgi:hypothetical protein